MNTNPKAQRILCYGDSNTWGWVPGKMGLERFGIHERWPGILRSLLGDEYDVIEEGLGARTTAYDDPRPDFPLRNGLSLFPIILESQSPVDVLVLMLGTTDTKELLNLSAEQTAVGMEKLIITAQNFKQINGSSIKKIIVVAPSVVDETVEFASKLFKGGTDKGKTIAPLYKALAEKYGCEFLDSNDYVTVDPNEGIHWTKESHATFAHALSDAIKKA